MKKKTTFNFNKKPLAAGIAMALGAATMSPAYAQSADNDVIEEVVVTGIRGSLQSSMIQKRDTQGVSDGVVAEDIGKFPDQNLAESMQRITGVSVNRENNGEGSRVTVRGVGPDFNLVTLNGRQMPGTTIEATASSDSRSFDFANLATEAVSAIQVYKTSQARLATGGMGATINIQTAKPFDNADMVASFGAKAVLDSSVENGDSATPEISGIFSNTYADGKFGVGISGSYQERNLGYNQASASSGWRTNFGDNPDGWGALPAEGVNGTVTTNRPEGIYQVPQNISYTFNDVQRTRTNGQLVLQFAPTDTITATLDYTYAENEILQQGAELSAWNGLTQPTTISSWTDDAVAGPISYSEVRDPNDPVNADPNGDFGGNAAEFGVVHELNSVGFNLVWDPTEQLSFALDFHNSESDSGTASPYGTNNAVGFFGFYRGTTTSDWSQDFPVYQVEYAPGTTGADVAQTYTTGSSFRNAVSTNEVQELRLSGSYFFDNDAYSLDFGVMTTEVDNQSAYANVQADSWGGVGSPDDFDDSLFSLDNVAGYFSNITGSNNPNLVEEFIRVDFPAAVAAAEEAIGGDRWGPTDEFQVDRRTTEETTAAYLQFNAAFDMGSMPANVAVGVRYEQTDVTSSALVPVATRILWGSANEFTVEKVGSDFTTLEGDYDYVLPSIDFNVELVEDLILRLSYSETIGRPGWGDIQGGQTIDDSIRINGGNGNQGDPGLLPLESTNIDLSFEWYYGSGSYASLAYFTKDISNYITIATITGTPFDLPHPGQGVRYAEANAATGGTGDPVAIRQYIFETYGDTPEVVITGTDLSGNFTGTIEGIAGEDPSSPFQIFVPVNAGEEGVDGWEVAVQHLFGDSGFGASANYTIVNTDNEYDNQNAANQFVLEGISDSANLIVFFENDNWSTRFAYNWRDEYLDGRLDGAGQPNPIYVEAYGQLDGIVSYNFNDALTVFVEGINITDEYTRSFARTQNAAAYVTTTGPRYTIGARYNFR